MSRCCSSTSRAGAFRDLVAGCWFLVVVVVGSSYLVPADLLAVCGRLVVQATRDKTDRPLVDGVARYLQRTGGDLGGGPYVLQRLDRGTTGVMLFSKSPAANQSIGVQFQRHTIRKTYLAACEGTLHTATTIESSIGRIGAIKFGVSAEAKNRKAATTAVAPLLSRPPTAAGAQAQESHTNARPLHTAHSLYIDITCSR